jgi:hypothetical protein
MGTGFFSNEVIGELGPDLRNGGALSLVGLILAEIFPVMLVMKDDTPVLVLGVVLLIFSVCTAGAL